MGRRTWFQFPEKTWMFVNMFCPCGSGGIPNSYKSFRDVGGRGKEVCSRVLSLKIGVEPRQIKLSSVWHSKLRLTIALCNDEFREPRSDTVSQV
ncbi:hypothetical protein TNCV_5061261 [Trichonephila clavipes]|nr:hypothetical protein TNCV_5061261 [Trichonephila clavipes]